MHIGIVAKVVQKTYDSQTETVKAVACLMADTIVATYFTVLPNETKKFYEEAMAYQEEEEKRNEELTDKVCHYVWHMKKAELQEALLQILFDGPDWQFDRFVRENGLEED